jgi:hypothetical protein
MAPGVRAWSGRSEASADVEKIGAIQDISSFIYRVLMYAGDVYLLPYNR